VTVTTTLFGAVTPPAAGALVHVSV